MPGARRVEPPAAERFLTVIPLRYAVASDVANALNKLRPNTRLVADERTNSLVLAYASQADLKELSDCIAKLDVQVGSGAK